MKEIGGYINLDSRYTNNCYDGYHCFNTASNALVYFIKTKKIKKIYIPYYLCDSVSYVLNMNKIQFDYYCLDKLFNPLLDSEINNNEWIYIVNYFGQLSNTKIIKLKEKYKRIIIDNVQSFFQKPVDDIPTIYSCRKYFGVPDGAYLYAPNVKKIKLKQDNSFDRYKHIIGRLDDNAKDYYVYFKENEEKLTNEECKYMSNSTHVLLLNIDYKFIIKQRNINYFELSNKLDKYNLLKLRKQNGPYCYPLCIKNGDLIRNELIENKIYVPILWPNVLELEECIEKNLLIIFFHCLVIRDIVKKI